MKTLFASIIKAFFQNKHEMALVYKQILLFRVLLVIGVCVIPFASYAIEVPVGAEHINIPTGAIDASIAAERVAPTTVQRPQATGKIAPAKVQPPQAIPGAEKVKFKLIKVNLTGVTAYPKQTIETIFSPYYQREISLAKLLSLVQDVTNKYRNDGYVLSKAIVPPQRISKGVVTVQVLEGYISDVKIQGLSSKRMQNFLMAYGDEAKREKPLNVKDLEHILLLANDVPGLKTQAVLNPSPKQTLATDLTLVSEQKHFEGFVSYDNYGTRYLGPQQITVNLNLDSIILPGDQIALYNVVTSDTDELRFTQMTYRNNWGPSGYQSLIGANYSVTHPGSILTPLEIRGLSSSFFAGVIGWPIRQRSKSLFWDAFFYYMNNSSDSLSVRLYDDRLRYLAVSGNYSFADQYRGSNFIRLGLTQGFKIMNYSPINSLTSRLDGKPNFTKLNTTLSREQFLWSDYSLFGSVSGQYAFSPVLASQQATFGGPEYGRGYDPSEIIGDSDAEGKVEFRKTKQYGKKYLNIIQYYAFYDAGAVWNHSPKIGVVRNSGTSTGIGARFNFNKYLSANFYAAEPLTRPVASKEAVGKNGKSPRYFFQLIAYF